MDDTTLRDDEPAKAEVPPSQFRMLLLAGFAAALGLLIAQRIFMALPVARATPKYEEASEANHAKLQEAWAAFLAGDSPEEAVKGRGKTQTVVEVREVVGAHVIRTESQTAEGPVAVAEVASSLRPAPPVQPNTPDDLPRLDPAAVARLLATPGFTVHRVRRPTRFSRETLTGLIVVSRGADLALQDVVLHGAIVSEGALNNAELGDFAGDAAPTVRVEGVLRIEPSLDLPDVAIVMPEGKLLTTRDASSLQIRGDIVAHTLSLETRGSHTGQMASVNQVIGPHFDRVGSRRSPGNWAPALDMRGSQAPEYVAYLAGDTRWDEVQPMVGFEFPGSVADTETDGDGETDS